MDRLESRIMRILDDRIGALGGIGYEDALARHGIDSVDIMESLVDIECAFDIEFEEGILTEDLSIRDVVDATRRLVHVTMVPKVHP
ncbi:Acyl carrier protein [Candidatus Tremblaya princeps]|uniref:Acyl carrier protein n=1 Tax=Tremblaya princeps TaxID=189385 RepID=A0A143WNV3_TREPR|nr:Acyl carrier protein [Candidatus Tremblaya princeps]